MHVSVNFMTFILGQHWIRLLCLGACLMVALKFHYKLELSRFSIKCSKVSNIKTPNSLLYRVKIAIIWWFYAKICENRHICHQSFTDNTCLTISKFVFVKIKLQRSSLSRHCSLTLQNVSEGNFIYMSVGFGKHIIYCTLGITLVVYSSCFLSRSIIYLPLNSCFAY